MYWDYNDVNMDGEVTLNEFCLSAIATYEFTLNSLDLEFASVYDMGYDELDSIFIDMDGDMFVNFTEWMLMTIQENEFK